MKRLNLVIPLASFTLSILSVACNQNSNPASSEATHEDAQRNTDSHVRTASVEVATAPGLAVGDKAPDAALTTVDGRTMQLASLYKDGPIVVTFYRGGWCPICNRALSAWAGKIEALKVAGGKLVALTPEKPDLAVRTREKSDADYMVFSDGAFEAANAFKVHFVVDDSTKAKYVKFGLKVAESNVSGTWELPAPATFVIDKDGVIRYAFADWDYTKRADPDEVIAAVRSLRR